MLRKIDTPEILGYSALADEESLSSFRGEIEVLSSAVEKDILERDHSVQSSSDDYYMATASQSSLSQSSANGDTLTANDSSDDQLITQNSTMQAQNNDNLIVTSLVALGVDLVVGLAAAFLGGSSTSTAAVSEGEDYKVAPASAGPQASPLFFSAKLKAFLASAKFGALSSLPFSPDFIQTVESLSSKLSPLESGVSARSFPFSSSLIPENSPSSLPGLGSTDVRKTSTENPNDEFNFSLEPLNDVSDFFASPEFRETLEKIDSAVKDFVEKFLTITESFNRNAHLAGAGVLELAEPLVNFFGFSTIEENEAGLPYLFETPELPPGFFEDKAGALYVEEKSNTIILQNAENSLLLSLSRYGDPSDPNPDTSGYVGQVEVNYEGQKIGLNFVHGLYVGELIEHDNGTLHHEFQTGGLADPTVHFGSEEVYSPRVAQFVVDMLASYRDQNSDEFWQDQSPVEYDNSNPLSQAAFVGNEITGGTFSPFFSVIIEESHEYDSVFDSSLMVSVSEVTEYVIADLLNSSSVAVDGVNEIYAISKSSSYVPESVSSAEHSVSPMADHGHENHNEHEQAGDSLWGQDGALNLTLHQASEVISKTFVRAGEGESIVVDYDRFDQVLEEGKIRETNPDSEYEDVLTTSLDLFQPIKSTDVYNDMRDDIGIRIREQA